MSERVFVLRFRIIALSFVVHTVRSSKQSVEYARHYVRRAKNVLFTRIRLERDSFTIFCLSDPKLLTPLLSLTEISKRKVAQTAHDRDIGTLKKILILEQL